MEVLDNPLSPCPPEVLRQQVALEVVHYNFESELAHGVIEVNEAVAEDVLAFFALARELRFPIHRVVRASDPEFLWDDGKLMAANATSGFNYRTIAGTDEVSKHGLGRAFDVNPLRNPYVRYHSRSIGKRIVAPAKAVWRPDVPGTLHGRHPLVVFMKGKGWIWGGDWRESSGRTDYQHLEKVV